MAAEKKTAKTDALRRQREAQYAKRQQEAPAPAPPDVVEAPVTRNGKREVVKK